MHKHLYRTVENLLDRIDNSAGDEQMLLDILQLLEQDLRFPVMRRHRRGEDRFAKTDRLVVTPLPCSLPMPRLSPHRRAASARFRLASSLRVLARPCSPMMS